ncbi:hypothetical protein F2Q69_00008316 [Brassica cretica]|uniref:cysteine dioxygenase n=1 Tax=Brassica cretica TaxID=69181 RepID=A0A8S9PCF0_BRACR|nr:hypothetical protein F2Q69_00008316 [Brassica cretica]
MLLLDSNANLMPGTVAASRVPTFGPHLTSGSMYSTTGFDVARCNPNFRLSDFSLFIRFSDVTSLNVLTEPTSPLAEECSCLESKRDACSSKHQLSTPGKQSDIVSSLNCHHLIIVVSSLDSHHLNQRRDPNRLTISSLAALTPHHLISLSSLVIIITLEGKPETRSQSSHLISSRSQSDQQAYHFVSSNEKIERTRYVTIQALSGIEIVSCFLRLYLAVSDYSLLFGRLYGSMHVKSYDWVEPDPSELDDPLQARPAKLVKDMTAPCPATTLYNLRYLISFVLSYILMEDTETTSGNPQSVTCLVNITGLRLSIVTMENVVDDNDDIWKAGEIEVMNEVISNVTWLEEYQPPDNFVIWKVPYR